MVKAAFVGPPDALARVYGGGRSDEIARRVDVVADPSEVEVVFSTWGIPDLSGFPRLRIVFYAAGTVQSFAPSLLARGVRVVSAWHANAVPVAEFTLAQILLAGKGYFGGVPAGNYGETVALLGAGAIGRHLIGLLTPFRLSVLVFDPFMTPIAGVEQVSLEEAFSRGLVVSNHLADKPETASLIGLDLLRRMRPGATFINTGRGRTVDHGALYAVLSERPDLTALLDVTDPEPLPSGSPLLSLPNVRVSPHIAGSLGNEVLRMADYMIEELDRYLAGEPLRYEVTDLSRMA